MKRLLTFLFYLTFHKSKQYYLKQCIKSRFFFVFFLWKTDLAIILGIIKAINSIFPQ